MGVSMNQMINNQRGVTAAGWLTILAVIAVFVMIVLRLFPLYNEKMTVISAMDSVANRPDAAELSKRELLKSFLKNVQVGGSRRFNDATVKQFVKLGRDKKTGIKTMTVEFENRNIFFQDIYFVMAFKRSVKLRGNEDNQ